MSLMQQTPLPRVQTTTTTTMFPPSLQSLEPVPQSSLPSGINVPSLLARVTPVQQQLLQQLDQEQQLLQQLEQVQQLLQQLEQKEQLL